MTRTISPGTKGVDFSFARPPAARLVELGYTFVVGYISVPPASPAKNITKAECEAYLGAGLKVLLVWEMSASRATMGATYGTLDGTNATALAKARDYPTDCVILAADDCSTTATNLPNKVAYMRAFDAACDYGMGIYGGVKILAPLVGLWKIGWVPLTAWSWSGSSAADAEAKARAIGAHVLQRKGFYIDNTWAVDPNDVIAPFPAWGLGNDPIPQPPQGDDDMSVITNAKAGQWGFVGQSKWWYDPLTNYKRALSPNNYTATGSTGGTPLSDEALAEIPDYVPGGPVAIDQVARDMATRNADALSDVRMGGQRIADAGGT